MRFLPANLDALLVELDDLAKTLNLLDSLQRDPIAGVVELIPAARTIMVRFTPPLNVDALVDCIGARHASTPADRIATLIEIPVDYSGEDIDEVAGLLGLSRRELIRRHTEGRYTVAFTGFAPGFAYLSGGDPALNVARRNTPRTRIPAGAVGLAGPFSGIYPRSSPGGWQIIGITETPMWDLDRDPPALLQPGFKVRFVEASRTAAAAARLPRRNLAQVPCDTGPALEIRSTGLQALMQDLGRHGLASQGVSTSGAMDRGALRTANRLVGNPTDAACIEIVDAGFEFRSRGDTVVALTGAAAPLMLIDPEGSATPASGHRAIALNDGDSIRLAQPLAGTRSYLAVRGGFVVPPVLGSCATDTLASLGPPPVRTGDVLMVRIPARGGIVGLPEEPRPDLPERDRTVVLDVVMGPRTDWFTTQAVSLLASQLWSVTPKSDRIGLRLAGAHPLARANDAELASEGTSYGAIQVPPDGQPVLFLADHPLTGGYPVIGAVAPHHHDRAGQIPIGARLRFNVVRGFSETFR